MSIFKKIIFLLSPKEIRSAKYLLMMILLMALLDMIGVVSILPFMTVLTNPSLIESNLILNKMFELSKIFGVNNNAQFLIFLGMLVFILLVLSLSFKMLTIYFQVRFVYMREYSISKRLIEGYLRQPYSWFLNRNSSDLGKNILSEVSQVIGNGVNPLMEVIAKGSVASALIILLIIIDIKLALIVGFSLGGFYGIIYKFTRNYLDKIGSERLKSNEERYKLVNEAFSATKELKAGGFEKTYLRLFSSSAETFAKTQTIAQIINQLPRFALEAIAFGGVILVILSLIFKTGSFNSAIPVISLYVFAGYRLMPALQQIYSALTQITFIGPSVDNLYKDIKNLAFYETIKKQDDLLFEKKISLKNISFEYPNAQKTSLKNINLIIPAKTKVGFIGTTGSGKTTTIDIILGLLEAQKGTLEVDNQIITNSNRRAWQRSIGYVPQHIYLADQSIEANIAFGLSPDKIDKLAVEKASKIANLHGFIIDKLPNKYQTIVGERGVRLSGGQRQRIGIARALYHDPKVLILDEATSSLDSQTEKAIMDALNNLNKEVTIILIAHRLNTIKECDLIYKLDNGKIVSKGTFNEVI